VLIAFFHWQIVRKVVIFYTRQKSTPKQTLSCWRFGIKIKLDNLALFSQLYAQLINAGLTLMTPQGILLAANDNMKQSDPHKFHYQKVLFAIMNNEAPDSNDISVLVQGIAMCGFMCTLDTQDVIEWINKRFGTSFTITGDCI